MSEPSKSTSLDLVLHILDSELFSDVCIPDSVPLGLSHYCSQEFHLSCLYFAFLSLSACPRLHSI
jgi:hypothetical protein